MGLINEKETNPLDEIPILQQQRETGNMSTFRKKLLRCNKDVTESSCRDTLREKSR